MEQKNENREKNGTVSNTGEVDHEKRYEIYQKFARFWPKFEVRKMKEKISSFVPSILDGRGSSLAPLVVIYFTSI